MKTLSILIILSLSFSLGIVFAADRQWPPSPSSSPGPQPPGPERPDHRCGNAFDNPPCGPGRCCSFYGWCGNTAAYCEGSSCQYQCWSSPSPIPSPIPIPSPTPPPPSPERPDHRCGKAFDNPPCGPGRCCSYYGWCGNTAAYCEGSSCQYQCWSSPSPIPSLSPCPSPQPPSPERPDHRCGKAFGDPPCGPGRCCSFYGWCGDTASYCDGASCQYQCWNTSRLTDLPRALLRNHTNN